MQTVTTVGYGDSVPITLGGKLVAALCMIVSLIIIPLPIAIFNANLTELYFEERSKRRAMRRAFEYMQKDESGVDWDVPSEVMTADVKSIGVLNSDDVGVVKEDENDVFASVGFSPSSQRSINQHSVTTVSNSSQLRHLLDLLSTYHGEFAKETESLSHSLTELREKQMMVQHWLIEAQKLNNPTNVGAISRKASKVFNQH